MKTLARCKHVAAGVAAALLFIFAAAAPLQAVPADAPDSEYRDIARGIDLFGDIYRELAAGYVEPIDVRALMYAAIDGMLASLDPYTVFLDEGKSEELGELTSGQYTGIGISMAKFGGNGKIYVTSVLESYPAWKAGMRIGDRIERINSVPLRGKTLEEIRAMIKGATGSRLSMTISRGGRRSPFSVLLFREEVRVSTVSYSGIIGDTGYVELDSFTSHSAEDIREALGQLLRESSGNGLPLKGLILDLRDNPGGLLTAAVDISALFVEKGSTIVTIRGRTPESEKIYKTEQPPMVANLPLAVLIDSESASASEIVSGAVQDLDRGVVLGERSYGKGLVQSIVRLPYDNTLKLTTAKYYTPSGRLIQKRHADTSSVRNVLKKNREHEPLAVYHTAGNRRVYGGGGIAPDVAVEAVTRSGYEQELHRQGMFFLFASRYRAGHAGPPDSPFERKALMDAFAAFLLQQDFSYRSPSEQMLRGLEESMDTVSPGKQPGTLPVIEPLRQELARRRQQEIARESERIARVLELEIMRHYNEAASRKAGIGDDPVVRKAIALLADRKAYSRMLRP